MGGGKTTLNCLNRSCSGSNGPLDQEAGKNRWVRRSAERNAQCSLLPPGSPFPKSCIPKIVPPISDNNEPSGRSLHRGFPLRWEEQSRRATTISVSPLCRLIDFAAVQNSIDRKQLIRWATKHRPIRPAFPSLTRTVISA